MNNYKILAIIVFYSLKLNAQYNPYGFQNFETDWTHHSYVEDLLEDDVQRYGLVYKFITDDYIYLLYNISDKKWYFNGFLIEKLDRLTGELIWNYDVFERSFYDRDYPSEMFLRDDGVLVLSSFRQRAKENQSTIWITANLNTWEIDDESGTLLDTVVTNPLDTNNVLLAIPETIFFTGTTQFFIHRTSSRINFIKSLAISQSVLIQSYDLSSTDGHSINDTIRVLPYRYPVMVDSKTIRLNENRIFNYRESETYARDSFNIEITMMDNELNILYSKNLTNDIDEVLRELCYVGESVFCVMQFGEKIFSGKPYRYQKLITYDYDGNIVDQRYLEKDDDSPLYSLNGFNVIYIEELKKTILVSFFKDDTGSYWEWFISSDDFTFEQLGKTYIQNEADNFSWDSNPSVFIDWLGDGKLLLHCLHLKTGSNTTGTMIPSISVVSLDEIRKTVSVVDEETLTEDVIYPNPANDYIMLLGNYNNNTKYEIFDLNKQLISSGNYSEKINIMNLINGIYVIKLSDDKGDLLIQKIFKL